MPALIVFAGRGSDQRADQIKVTESAQVAVKKLADADGGFAVLTHGSKSDTKLWINRDQVRLVRSA